MTPRPWIRGLALCGGLLLLLAVCVFVARSLWRPSTPAPAEEPVQSEDESEVLMARTADPSLAAPGPRPVEAFAPAPAAPAAPDPTKSLPAGESSYAPGTAGMVVGLDPETGTWGPPTPEQLRELAALRDRTQGDAHRVAKPEGWLPEVHHRDGHVSVDLNGQFQEFTTVRVGPDGKPVFTCVHGPDEAERAALEPAPPALEER